MSSLLSGSGIPEFSGDLITPQDSRYDQARRLWNGLIDRRPALIARCVSTRDVVVALRHALQCDLRIAVRGGGHSVPGHSVCDGGMVIDLGRLNRATLDPASGRARAQGGCLLRDLDQATQAHGLAVPAGMISHTGVGGLTLGGGLGHLMRRSGLSIDSLVSAELVTASGEVLRVSTTDHPELFWAIRGGGGNFGIVTEFEFNVHGVDAIYVGLTIHRLERARPSLERWRETMPTAPDELLWTGYFRKAPPLPWMPEDLVNEPVLLSSLEWSGELSRGQRYIRPIVESLEPDFQMEMVVPYLQLQSAWDHLVPHGCLAYCKAGFFNELTDSTFGLLIEHGSRVVSLQSQLEVLPLGGAIDRVDHSASSFPHRGSKWVMNALGIWQESKDTAANIKWVRNAYRDLEPLMSGGAYVNYMGGEETGGARAAYGSTLHRLQSLKAQYDPHNVFSLNQNILPIASLRPERSVIRP